MDANDDYLGQVFHVFLRLHGLSPLTDRERLNGS